MSDDKQLKGEEMPVESELDPKIKIRAPLRCDGIGRLDCAEDVERGVRMAVRWLPLEANGDAAARAMRALPAHPTLPRIQKTGRVGTSAYVAMDFPEGRLLSTMLGEALRVEDLCRIGSDIADALATIHAQGVFHGEMSADSLLLMPGQKAILWDMPLVIANRVTERRGEERAMAQLPRMAAFLSPERAQGAAASAASDVFALGAVLCLAGGGRMPDSSSTLGTVYQIASGRWSPDVPAAYPPAVRSVLKLMVNANPAMRPSAREVAEALATAHRVPTVPEMPAIAAPVGAPVIAPVAPVAAGAPAPVSTGAGANVVGTRTPQSMEAQAHPLGAVVVAGADMPGRGAKQAEPRVALSTVAARPAPTLPNQAVVVAPELGATLLGVEKKTATPPPLPKAAVAADVDVVEVAAVEVRAADVSVEVPVDAPVPLWRQPKMMIWAGAALAALIIGLGSTALYLALRPRGTEVRSPSVATAPVKRPMPAPDSASNDADEDDGATDLVAPLPKKKVVVPAKPFARAKAAPAPGAPAAKASAPAAQEDGSDFSFLQGDGEKPKAELKRPEF